MGAGGVQEQQAALGPGEEEGRRGKWEGGGPGKGSNTLMAVFNNDNAACPSGGGMPAS